MFASFLEKYSSTLHMTLAGLPPITTPSSKIPFTTLPAATMELFDIFVFGKIIYTTPIKTLSPISILPNVDFFE